MCYRYVLFSLLLLIGCSPEPEPVRYGEDSCAYCKMVITDHRYGSELVTDTGKKFKFDSVECLAAYLQADSSLREHVHSLWVTDFRNPSRLIQVSDAFFLHSPSLRSPMGLNLTAFGPNIGSQDVQHSFGGDILKWQEVLGLVEKEWLREGSHQAMQMKPHTDHTHSASH